MQVIRLPLRGSQDCKIAKSINNTSINFGMHDVIQTKIQTIVNCIIKRAFLNLAYKKLSVKKKEWFK